MTAPAPMTTALARDALAAYVARQLDTFFPDGPSANGVSLVLGDTLDRLERCLGAIRRKGYWSAVGPHFDHLHTEQYATFLYYLANTAHRRGETVIARKAYALNKALHAFEAFYEIELPAVFTLVHPIGTVLGRATYGEYFCAYQNVLVGVDTDRNLPTLGTGVVMYGGSRVVGNVTVGNNCFISIGACVMEGRVPDNHAAFGQHPDVILKPTSRNVRRDVFRLPE